MTGDRPLTYSFPARFLHWTTAVLVFGLVIVGVTMTNLGDAWESLKGNLYEMHKTFGLIAFGVVVLRILWRLVKSPPPPEPSLSAFELMASKLVHNLLYALVFVMPILGWAGTSMCCSPVQLFRTWEVPFKLQGSFDTAKVILKLHEIGAWMLVILVGLHVAGALYHRIVKRDGVMARMLPPKKAAAAE